LTTRKGKKKVHENEVVRRRKVGRKRKSADVVCGFICRTLQQLFLPFPFLFLSKEMFFINESESLDAREKIVDWVGFEPTTSANTLT
jgi:hypothetical protein